MALQEQSAREQARAEWGSQQGRYPALPDGEPPTLADTAWFWIPVLVPIALVSLWALVAFLEPSWLLAFAEYVK